MKSEKTAVSSGCLNKRARNSEIVPGFRHFEMLCVRCEIDKVHGRCCKYVVKLTKYIERAASTLSKQQRTWKMLQVRCEINNVHSKCPCRKCAASLPIPNKKSQDNQYPGILYSNIFKIRLFQQSQLILHRIF